MRSLDPKTTYYIDADGKGLSWKGWRSQYNSENKNYKQTSDAHKIGEILNGISEKCPDIKTVVVDTLNSIMVDDEFARMKEKNFDKWSDLAFSVYGLIDSSHKLRDGLTVIFVGHTQTEYDDSGFRFTRMKTNGKKLDKIVLESKFTTVLLAKGNKGKYVFETQANDSTAKAPMGAFEDAEVPNDMAAVLAALVDY
jgi:hypothetical protein